MDLTTLSNDDLARMAQEAKRSAESDTVNAQRVYSDRLAYDAQQYEDRLIDIESDYLKTMREIGAELESRHPRCFARRHNGWDIEEDSHAS